MPVSAISSGTGRSGRRRSSPRWWRSGTCSVTTWRRGSAALSDAIGELDAVAARSGGARPHGFGSKPACRPRTCSTGAWSSPSNTAGPRSRWPSDSAMRRPSCTPWPRSVPMLVFEGQMAEGWAADGDRHRAGAGRRTSTTSRRAGIGCSGRARRCSSSTTWPRPGCQRASRTPSASNAGTTATTWRRISRTSCGRPDGGTRPRTRRPTRSPTVAAA